MPDTWVAAAPVDQAAARAGGRGRAGARRGVPALGEHVGVQDQQHRRGGVGRRCRRGGVRSMRLAPPALGGDPLPAGAVADLAYVRQPAAHCHVVVAARCRRRRRRSGPRGRRGPRPGRPGCGPRRGHLRGHRRCRRPRRRSGRPRRARRGPVSSTTSRTTSSSLAPDRESSGGCQGTSPDAGVEPRAARRRRDAAATAWWSGGRHGASRWPDRAPRRGAGRARPRWRRRGRRGTPRAPCRTARPPPRDRTCGAASAPTRCRWR